MENNYQILINKLDNFIRKYYKNRLLKGSIYAIGLLLLAFVFFTSLEYIVQFNTSGRTLLFYSFVAISGYVLVYFIIIPLAKLYQFGKIINRKQAAEIVGNHFEEVKDKLINVLQLEEKATAQQQNNGLLFASINQKAIVLKPVPFANAIQFSENKKYLKYALIPLLLILLISLFSPSVFTESTQRLINHNAYIAPVAPFKIEISNQQLTVLKNEDYTLEIAITGNQLPSKVYLQKDGNKLPLTKTNNRTFSYTFKNVQQNEPFKIYASGFYSPEYELKMLPNPLLNNFTIELNYPNYIKKPAETLNNTGDLIVPEGTKIKWNITTEDADNLQFILGDSAYAIKPNKQLSVFSLKAIQSSSYGFVPQNSFVQHKDTTFYNLQVIKDKFPTIETDERQDSTNQNRFYFKGLITDDYGFAALTFNYKIKTIIDSLPQRNELKIVKIPFNKVITSEEFFHFWDVKELNILPGDEIEYYFEVWDNDGVNGSKSSRTALKTFKSKTIKERNATTESSNKNIKKELSESVAEAKDIQKELEKLKQKLAEKKEIGWEEKQKMKELLEKQKELQKRVEKIEQENQKNNEQQNEYKQYNEELLQKQEQLQKLFDELMTDEMKEMMEKLQEMMEKLDKSLLDQELEKMQLSNKDLEKELDRSLELFKQMEFEQKLDEVKSKLEELADKQEKLSEETEKGDKNDPSLKEKQDELNKEFNETKKELDALKKMDEELQKPNGMEDTKEAQEEISKDQKESSEQLENKKNNKASKSQKSAAQKMNELAQKMSALQAQTQQQGEDMDALRQLLDNLVHLSFEQEKLMESYKKTNRQSPEYVKMTQQQKKLKDDAKMIEDSLFALSKRVVQLQSVVNKEINLINANMEKTIEFMAERMNPMAAARQQYVMTSLNNLALLFDEALQQMQQQAQKQGQGSCDKPGGGGKPKPGPGGMGNIKKMQEQLSKQLEQMEKALKEGQKPGGKKPGEGMGMPGGQGTSESLAKMAAQQAKIRSELQKLKNKGAQGTNGLSKLMEENEQDIVNKRITQETIHRQQEILTRLLESEKAEREREWDDKRESKEAKAEEKTNPSHYFNYNKEKEQEVELLKTTPPNLTQFYKNKVTQYFHEINQ
ncbi:MAG: hypothetical protein K0B10_09980 [Vicingaceae bacterium]|nr:hypothetical protein [Vicingaceae bacterium]